MLQHSDRAIPYNEIVKDRLDQHHVTCPDYYSYSLSTFRMLLHLSVKVDICNFHQQNILGCENVLKIHVNKICKCDVDIYCSNVIY